MQYRSASSQRLRNGFTQGQLMRACQHIATIAVFCIDGDLNIAQQFRQALDFVQDELVWKLGEECLGILFGEAAYLRLFEVGIGIVGEGMSRKGGLAGLPRPKQGDDRVFLQQGV